MEKLPDYSSKTFLLVDDESFMLGLVERVLKQCQAGQIQRAPNGARALEMFRGSGRRVDCIIADLNMKPMNGLEFLWAIRTGVSKKVQRDQRYLMLTGHGDSDAVKAAIALDIQGYVLKPISIEKLVTAVDLALARSLTLKTVAHYRSVKLPQMDSAPQAKQEDDWIY